MCDHKSSGNNTLLPLTCPDQKAHDCDRYLTVTTGLSAVANLPLCTYTPLRDKSLQPAKQFNYAMVQPLIR